MDQVTVWFQYRCLYVCFIRVTHNVLFESVGNGVMVYIIPLELFWIVKTNLIYILKITNLIISEMMCIHICLFIL